MRTTWPVVGRLGADPSRICLEIIKPERCPDRELLEDMVAEHRKRGALVALDDLSGGPDSLACLELLRPDIAKIDTALTAGIQHSAGPPRAGQGAGRLRPRARRARSSPRASSASTSSARWPSSASTSARASTSVSRPSGRWRSTPASSARPSSI